MLAERILKAAADAAEAATDMTTEPTTEVIGESLKETVEKANQFLDHLENMIPSIINFGINILIAIVIFGFGKILIQFFLKMCNKFFEKANMEISVKKFLLSLIKSILFVILAITICGQLGIETTSFIAVIGSAGLALGLAFQGSLSNFAGGVLILVMKPFKVGDYISESGTGREGTVQQIDICYTTLITPDNKKVVIPNGNLSNSSLTNASAFEKRRVDIEVGISYSADISEAKTEMENLAKSHELVLKEEDIFSFVSNLDSSQVTMGLRVWCLTSDYWTVKFELTEGIKKTFDEKGIEIPFNQLVVHLDN